MIRIGKIVATHGVTGAVIMTHIVGNSKWLKKDHTLLIEMKKGSFIPHFITGCKAATIEEYHLTLEDVNSVDNARRLVAKNVYVEEALLAGYEKQSPLLWIGFTLTDRSAGKVGTIDDVLQTGHQWLARLTINNKEVLIPLIETMIDKLDLRNRTIHMTLPDGLLDIYM